MSAFSIENHGPFGSLTGNCLWLGKSAGRVSAFSAFVVCGSAVGAVQESDYVECFTFCQ